MITHIHSDFAAGNRPLRTLAQRLSPNAGRRSRSGASPEGAAETFGTWSSEPSYGSLWNPSLLDQLQAPLTRFHE